MRWEALLNLEPGGSVVTVWLLRTDGASERRSENRPALQRRYSKTKRDPPSRRPGVKRRNEKRARRPKPPELLNS